MDCDRRALTASSTEPGLTEPRGSKLMQRKTPAELSAEPLYRKDCENHLRSWQETIRLARFDARGRESEIVTSLRQTAFTLRPMISTHSSISAAVMHSGGAKRMMLPCVGLASNPFSAIFTQMSQA